MEESKNSDLVKKVFVPEVLPVLPAHSNIRPDEELRNVVFQIAQNQKQIVNKLGVVQDTVDFIQEDVKDIHEVVTQKFLKNEKVVRETLPLRDALSLQDFKKIVEHTFTLESNIQKSRGAQNKFSRVRFAQIRTVITLLFITGCRINEVSGLSYEEIKNSLRSGKITIKQTKTNEYRDCGICDIAHEMLEARKPDMEFLFKASGFSFLGCSIQKPHEIMHSKSMIRLVNTFLTQFTLDFNPSVNIKSHSFRASFVTRLLRQTNDLSLVSELIGHKSLNVTERYKRHFVGALAAREIHNLALNNENQTHNF